MPETTAVTFDLWQTLLLDRPEMGQVRTQARLDGARAALLKAGHSYDAETVETAYRDCARRCQRLREQLLDLSFQEQVRLFLEGIRPGLVTRLPEAAFREVATAYSDAFFQYPPKPHPSGIDVLQAVKDMGLSIGLISNTGMTPGVAFRRFLQEHGMLDYFAVLTFSDEVQVAKPSPEIFRMTLRALGALPHQTIHVGDHPNSDVTGAKDCGIKAVWIEGFYPWPAPASPDTEPDATIADLAAAAAAIAQLTGRQ